MTTLPRQFHSLILSTALLAGLCAHAQTPAADPAKLAPTDPLPAPLPVTPPDQPLEKPAVKPAPKAAGKSAAKTVAKKPDAKKAEVKKSEPSFSGKITEADKVNFTLTLTKERVLHVTSQTRIFKGGKPAVFDDAAVGEEVSGQSQKGADGQLEAVVIHIGAKASAPVGGKKTEKKPAEKSPGDPKPEEKKPTIQ